MRIGLLVMALMALCPLSLVSQRPAIGADARIPMTRAEDVGMTNLQNTIKENESRAIYSKRRTEATFPGTGADGTGDTRIGHALS